MTHDVYIEQHDSPFEAPEDRITFTAVCTGCGWVSPDCLSSTEAWGIGVRHGQ